VLWTERQEDGRIWALPSATEVILGWTAEVQADDGIITREPSQAFRGQQNRPPTPVKHIHGLGEHVFNIRQPEPTADENLYPEASHFLTWLVFSDDSPREIISVHRFRPRKWLPELHGLVSHLHRITQGRFHDTREV